MKAVVVRQSVRWVLAAGALAIGGAGAFAGCGEEKMAPAQCDKLRAEAFKILNEAQPCATDTDCKEASFPQCRRPINAKNAELAAGIEKQVTEGHCETKVEACKDSPPVYCKQGLCSNREPGVIQEY